VLRGGIWTNGQNAGLFGVYLYDAPSSTRSNIGFRCPPEHQKTVNLGFLVVEQSSNRGCEGDDLPHLLGVEGNKPVRRENCGLFPAQDYSMG